MEDSWAYAYFVIPITVVAVGMGLSNGPASAASTACVEPGQVGSASGISNMARYVGAAVAVAAVSSVYTSVSSHRVDDGIPLDEALASGLGWACVVLTISSAAGIAMGLFGRYRQRRQHAMDTAAATAAHSYTIPKPHTGAASA